MNKKTFSIKKCFLSFLFLVLALSSCGSPSSKENAPKDIANLEFVFVYNKVNPDFKPFQGKELTFEFHADLTYESFLDKKKFAAGDYAYNKTGIDTAELSISYTSGVSIEDQIIHLFFETPFEGDFEEIPYSEKEDNQTGTFSVREAKTS